MTEPPTGSHPSMDAPQHGSEREPPSAAEHFHEGKEAPPPGVFVMGVVRWAIVAAMATVAAASLYAALANRGHESAEHADAYYCPMHPQIVQDHPGECPICNMMLVKGRPAAGAPAAATMSPAHLNAQHVHDSAAGRVAESAPGLVPLALPLDRVQRIGMKSERVTKAALSSSVRAFFTIAPAEGASATIQTRYAGWVQELHVGESGAAVRKGQLLARVYSPDLLAAQQELLNAKHWSGDAQLGDGPAMLENARKRLVLLGMPRAQVDAVEKAGELQQLVEVRSETSGFVAEKVIVEGQYIQPGNELFRITDLSRVWAVAELFERDAGALRVGQAATLTLAAYPGETFRGKVALVYPTLDAATRTVRARIELDNKRRRLMPGMFGEVALDLSAREGLTIAREALIDVGAHQYVFVERAPGEFEPRSVQPGVRMGDRVEVREGLREGETVVTTGNFLLDSESRLRATVGGASTSEHAHRAAP